MIDLNDELLSAYLDEELDAPTRAAVASALSKDPGARVRLERLHHMDSLLRAAVPAPPARDDDPLAARILRGAPATRTRNLLAAGLAAMAAGICGFTIGTLLPRTGADPLEAQGSLARALEAQPSGAAPGAVRILLSTRLPDGRYCRQFQLRDAGEGLACRGTQAEVDWRLVVWDGSVSTAGFQPAAAGELIDATLDRLGAGEALDAAAERQQISNGWGSGVRGNR